MANFKYRERDTVKPDGKPPKPLTYQELLADTFTEDLKRYVQWLKANPGKGG